LSLEKNNYTGIPIVLFVRDFNSQYDKRSISDTVAVYGPNRQDTLEFIDSNNNTKTIYLYSHRFHRNEDEEENGNFAHVTKENISAYKKIIKLDIEISKRQNEVKKLKNMIERGHQIVECVKNKEDVLIFLKCDCISEQWNNQSEIDPDKYYAVAGDSNKGSSRWFYDIFIDNDTLRINLPKEVKAHFKGNEQEYLKSLTKTKEIEKKIVSLSKRKDVLMDSIEWLHYRDKTVQEVLKDDGGYYDSKFNCIYTEKGSEKVIQEDTNVANAIRVMLGVNSSMNPKTFGYFDIFNLSSILPGFPLEQFKNITKHCDIIQIYSPQQQYQLGKANIVQYTYMIPIPQLSLVLKDLPEFIERMEGYDFGCDINKAEIDALKLKAQEHTLHKRMLDKQKSELEQSINDEAYMIADTLAKLKLLGADYSYQEALGDTKDGLSMYDVVNNLKRRFQ